MQIPAAPFLIVIIVGSMTGLNSSCARTMIRTDVTEPSIIGLHSALLDRHWKQVLLFVPPLAILAMLLTVVTFIGHRTLLKLAQGTRNLYKAYRKPNSK